MKINYAVVSEQGLREDMEDTYCVTRQFAGRAQCLFAGVFDGHSGTYAAHIASTEVPQQFLLRLGDGLSVRQAFRASFKQASDDVIAARSTSGACATTLFIREASVFFANAGDCALAALRGRHLRVLTNQHRVGNPIEEERVRQCGGSIFQGYIHVGDDGLQPLRSIGDAKFKKVGVIAEPECGVIRVTQPMLLLLGTDGLFDFVEVQQISRLLSLSQTLAENTDQLRSAVESARPLDNYTFILFALSP